MGQVEATSDRNPGTVVPVRPRGLFGAAVPGPTGASWPLTCLVVGVIGFGFLLL